MNTLASVLNLSAGVQCSKVLPPAPWERQCMPDIAISTFLSFFIVKSRSDAWRVICNSLKWPALTVPISYKNQCARYRSQVIEFLVELFSTISIRECDLSDERDALLRLTEPITKKMTVKLNSTDIRLPLHTQFTDDRKLELDTLSTCARNLHIFWDYGTTLNDKLAIQPERTSLKGYIEVAGRIICTAQFHVRAGGK